ncbi:hypothetical protein NGG16_16060 [Enterococcus casseliflavus]|uniref:hypothetical protein n=1 Tax=Enterococcus casseliflavus TaxID=37734 RepID=UPI002DBA6AE2|nr:hypothetical protein [Enterococcus casseliflavus]MEB8418949.1 hypothetical protein [Enterococcus casseliflavus]
MSLSNEQRAHDLALLTVKAEINRQLLSQLIGADYDEIEFDIYQNYHHAYQQALDAFNLDFPEE